MFQCLQIQSTLTPDLWQQVVKTTTYYFHWVSQGYWHDTLTRDTTQPNTNQNKQTECDATVNRRKHYTHKHSEDQLWVTADVGRVTKPPLYFVATTTFSSQTECKRICVHNFGIQDKFSWLWLHFIGGKFNTLLNSLKSLFNFKFIFYFIIFFNFTKQIHNHKFFGWLLKNRYLAMSQHKDSFVHSFFLSFSPDLVYRIFLWWKFKIFLYLQYEFLIFLTILLYLLVFNVYKS